MRPLCQSPGSCSPCHMCSNKMKSTSVAVSMSALSSSACMSSAVSLHLKTSIWGTLCDINCLYSETQVMLKLARRARGHFVTLIEIRGKTVTRGIA